MTSLSNLKESRLPRYTSGTSSSDYKGKVLSAASSRSRARDALEGVLSEELRLAATTNTRGDDGYLSDDEILARESENKRAYDDLLGVMTGKLVGVVRKAKSDMFPEGCAYTGFTEALKKIKEITDGEEEDLLREFGELDVLEKGDDPKDHFERLENVMDSLEEHHQIIKTEAELVNQMLSVLEQDSDYDSAVKSM